MWRTSLRVLRRVMESLPRGVIADGSAGLGHSATHFHCSGDAEIHYGNFAVLVEAFFANSASLSPKSIPARADWATRSSISEAARVRQMYNHGGS
jgi:hypothetical protein